jgi:serine/threonine-protein kinase
MALLVVKAVRRDRLPPEAFTRIAQLFLVLSSLGIAAYSWGWQFFPITGRFEGVHWVGVWIVSFSATVTLTPGIVFRAGLLSSSMIAVIILGSPLLLGFPPDLEQTGWRIALDMLVLVLPPVWICVGIACAISARVFHLAKDASNARRLGSYQLEEKLGAGGMGEVWRASHRLLARPAAIKLIREQGRTAAGESSRTALRRFEREAQATAALTSPHTVQVYDFGVTREGAFYYVMELLRGLDLRTLVERTGPVSAPRTLHFLRQACDSLAEAHRQGMIHRDIKPANLFTCQRGLAFDFIKVLDFGLVKESGRHPKGDSQLTIQGLAGGTPGYMAPEMATESQEIDGRADLYALGCVGYWLLTGEMVFAAESPIALLLKHVNDAPPSPRTISEAEIPPVVEEIIMDCLAKSPADRPRSAEELGRRVLNAELEVGAWTPDQAEDWWRLHLSDLTEPSARAASVESSATLEIRPN